MKMTNYYRLMYFVQIVLISSFISSTFGLRLTNVFDQKAKNEELPENILYFGWFVNETTSVSLKAVTDFYFNTIIEQVDAAKSYMECISEQNNVTDIMKYFTKPLDPGTGKDDPYYHITAMFCGDKDCSDYYTKYASYLGNVFKTELVGVFFTERTFGIRISLSKEQENLFDMEKHHRRHYSVKTKNKRAFNSSYPGIMFEEQKLDFQPTKSRAHITLACGPGVQAVETGFDLFKVIQYEAEATSGDIIYQDFLLEDSVGTLRSYSKWNSTTNHNDTLAFVLYPTYKMILNTTFDAYVMPSKSNNFRPYYALMIFFSVCLYWKLR